MKPTIPGVFFAMRVLTGIVGISVPILLAHSMSVDDFALYATISAASGLAVALSSLGIDRVSLNFLPRFAGQTTVSALVRFLCMLTAPRVAALGIVLVLLIWTRLWLPHSRQDSTFEYATVAVLVVALSSANAMSQLAASYAQGLLLHGGYALVAFFAVLVRASALLSMFFVYRVLRFNAVIWVFVASEALSVVALLMLIWRTKSVFAATNTSTFEAPSIWEAVRVSRSNYVAYLAGIPWLAPTLVILVGNFCSREVTAAYAFFQTLADRARQFLPVQLLQSYVEPLWAKRFQSRQRIIGFQTPLSTLMSANMMLLSLALCWVVAAGQPIVGRLTKPVYGDHLELLVLILVQVMASTVGALLWIGLNATCQSSHLAKSTVRISVAGAPLLLAAVAIAGAPGVIVCTWIPSIALLWLLRSNTNIPFTRLSLELRKTGITIGVGAVVGALGLVLSRATSDSFGGGAAVLLLCTLAWGLAIVKLVPPNRAQRFLIRHFVHGRGQK